MRAIFELRVVIETNETLSSFSPGLLTTDQRLPRTKAHQIDSNFSSLTHQYRIIARRRKRPAKRKQYYHFGIKGSSNRTTILGWNQQQLTLRRRKAIRFDSKRGHHQPQFHSRPGRSINNRKMPFNQLSLIFIF